MSADAVRLNVKHIDIFNISWHDTYYQQLTSQYRRRIEPANQLETPVKQSKEAITRIKGVQFQNQDSLNREDAPCCTLRSITAAAATRVDTTTISAVNPVSCGVLSPPYSEGGEHEAEVQGWREMPQQPAVVTGHMRHVHQLPPVRTATRTDRL